MSTQKRYLELDALRGLAIVAMVVYHILFDLAFLFDVSLPISTSVWQPWSKPIAFTFLLLVGISSTISWQRSASYHRIQKLFKRFFILVLGALLISLVTYIFVPKAYVRFGILHLIALSVLLQPLFQRFNHWNICIAGLWFGVGGVLLSVFTIVDSDPIWSTLFLPLGVMYPGFTSVDYYPLMPWFSVILLGMGLGSWLYPKGSSGYLQMIVWPRWLTWLGRKSLLVYFIHQPIIFCLLWLCFFYYTFVRFNILTW